MNRIATVALGAASLVVGALKLPYLWTPVQESAIPGLDPEIWRAALITSCVVESALGLMLVFRWQARRARFLVMALFAGYGIMLVTQEIVAPEIAACGCLGPQVRIGYAGHLAVVGFTLLLAMAARPPAARGDA